MNRIKGLLPALAAVVLLAGSVAPAFAAGPPEVAGPPEFAGRPPFAGRLPMQTIVELADENPDFDILVLALELSGLDGALDGKGQFTVFAPTNAAFDAAAADLGISTDALLSFLVANPDVLEDILLYHVAPGRRNSRAVIGSSQINTLQGAFLYQSGGVLTDQVGREVDIVATDIMASNGVIHVINNVVLPYNPLAP